MHSLSAFFTSYSAHRGGAKVEAVALVVSDGEGTEPALRFVVVDEGGHASLAPADEVDLYGVIEDARLFAEQDAAREAGSDADA